MDLRLSSKHYTSRLLALTSITSELAKVQYIMYDVAVDLKVAVVTVYVIAARRDEYRSIHATE